jgi:hypothetical protein
MSNRLRVTSDSGANQTPAGITQHDLDRLVDGDLGADERRNLVAALATEPDGWQRCALVFLEAQSWRQACRQMVAEPSGPPSAARPLVRPLWRRRELRRASAGIAAAAAVLALVFCGGLATGRSWPGSSSLIAGKGPPSACATAGDVAAGASQNAVADDHGTNGNGSPGAARTLVHVLGFINVQGEDGARHAVPILAAPGLKLDAPRRSPATLAAREPEIDRAGEPRISASTGARDSEPITFPLPDGRRVAIPDRWLNLVAQSQSVY